MTLQAKLTTFLILTSAFSAYAEPTLTLIDAVSTNLTIAAPADNLIIVTNGGLANITFPTLTSSNTIIVTGADSLLNSSLVLAENAAANRLIISNAATVIASELRFGSGDTIAPSAASLNTLQIVGQSSGLRAGSITLGPANLLEISGRATGAVETATLSGNLSIAGYGSWFQITNTLNFTGPRLNVIDGALDCYSTANLGAASSDTEIFIGNGFLGARYLNIRNDYGALPVDGEFKMIISNSYVRAYQMKIGSNSRLSKNTVIFDGGNLELATPDKSEVLEIENATFNVLSSPYLIKARELRIIGTNVAINTGSFTMDMTRRDGLVTSYVSLRLRNPSNKALINCSSFASLGGLLSFTIEPNHTFKRGDDIVVLKAEYGISGAFQHVNSGARLFAPEGTFRLNITTNTVSLDDFVPTETGDPQISFSYMPTNSALSLWIFIRPALPGIQTSTDLVHWEDIPSPGFEYFDTIYFRWNTTPNFQEPARYFRTTLTE